MGVPKKKLTRTRSRARRSANQRFNAGWGALCNQCRSPIRPHTVCSVCGYYRGKQILKPKTPDSK